MYIHTYLAFLQVRGLQKGPWKALTGVYLTLCDVITRL